MKRKVDSRELGLVITEKLLGIDDLHYGYWDGTLALCPQNFPRAQARYSEFLLSHLPPPDASVGIAPRLLDIGCGSGATLVRLLSAGYAADGLCPAPALCQRVRERLAALPGTAATLFECTLEALPPLPESAPRYDICLFSESFQYIDLGGVFERLATLLRPGGVVVICDFFATAHRGDGGPGDGSFGGGHDLRAFYATLARHPFTIETDEDITAQISPNLELLNSLLMERIKPVLELTGTYLEGKNPLAYRLIGWLARRRLQKIRFKYFSGHRSRATFERYKTYRLIVLRYNG